MQGDVIGIGYRPRSGTIFFTRNGKKLDDVVHGLKSQNFFPTVGANGPCMVHVNFGQMGFVFIEANVKKWGLAPMTGSLAPPPPYGSEQGSILLESGRESAAQRGYLDAAGYSRPSAAVRVAPPPSPGPLRSPTDISLAQLSRVPSHDDDGGEGSSRTNLDDDEPPPLLSDEQAIPPPEYSSPPGSPPPASDAGEGGFIRPDQPPIPSYDAAVGNLDHTTPDVRHDSPER